jgi:hypothetical protein
MIRLLATIGLTACLTASSAVAQSNKQSWNDLLKPYEAKTKPVVTVAPQPAVAPVRSDTYVYQTMDAMTGCNSKSSDEKKALLFKNLFEGNDITVTGEISTLDRGTIGLKVRPGTITFDVDVKMRDPKITFDMEKGQRVNLTFKATSQGGCILPFSGSDGVLN